MRLQVSQKQSNLLQLADDPQLVELLIGGAAGGPLDINSYVQTPSGPISMAKIKVGDVIYDARLQPQTVVDIPFVGVELIYNITLENGSVVRSSGGHVWKVMLGNSWRLIDIDDLLHHKSYLNGDDIYLPQVVDGEVKKVRIVDISPDNKGIVKCITVSSDDGLFLTDDFIVTHNSKTFSMGLIVALWARKYPGIVIALGKKTLKSLRATTVSTLLYKVHPALNISEKDYKYNTLDGEIKYANGSRIVLVELDYIPSDPDFARLGSLEFDVGFIDEAGEITLKAKDVLKSRLGRGDATKKYSLVPSLISSANPSHNYLRTEYYNPYKKMGGGEFQKWQIGTVFVNGRELPAYRAFLVMKVYDNPFLDPNYIKTLEQLPDRERKRLLDGDWDYSDTADMLFDSVTIDDATLQELPGMGVAERNNYFFGVDISDVGSDSTRIAVLQNGILVKIIEIKIPREAKTNQNFSVGDFIADKIIQTAGKYGLTVQDARRIAIEVNGIGVSTRDSLRRKKWRVKEYVAQGDTRSRGYYNLHENMINNQVLIYAPGIDDYQELRRQLAPHTYVITDSKPKVRSKRDIKKELGCSPDMADALMIANYAMNGDDGDAKRYNTNRIYFGGKI